MELIYILLSAVTGVVLTIIYYRFKLSKTVTKSEQGSNSDIDTLNVKIETLKEKLNDQIQTHLNEKSVIIRNSENEIRRKEDEFKSLLNEQIFKQLNEKNDIIRNGENEIRKKEDEFKSQEKLIREDAIKRSKSVMLGKMWEQIVPYYRPDDFKFIPSDARFLGSPVDFIIFNGSSESDINEVIFLEIKTSKSRLNSQQVKLKKLIDSLKSKEVRWETINIPIEIDKSDDIKE